MDHNLLVVEEVVRLPLDQMHHVVMVVTEVLEHQIQF
jgi:hypothetical protein